MTTQTTFEYDEDLAIDSVNQILASLCCDLTHWGKLAEVYQEEGDLNGADLEEDHPEAYECWENIQDEIYGRLTDNDIICEDFCDQFGGEADELGDYIDDAIQIDLATYLEVTA